MSEQASKMSPGLFRALLNFFGTFFDYVKLYFFCFRSVAATVLGIVKYIIFFLSPLALPFIYRLSIKLGFCESHISAYVLISAAALLLMAEIARRLPKMMETAMQKRVNKCEAGFDKLQVKAEKKLRSFIELTGEQALVSCDLTEIILPVTAVFSDRVAPNVEITQPNGEMMTLPTRYYSSAELENGGLAVKIGAALPWNQEKFTFSFNGKGRLITNPWHLTADMIAHIDFQAKGDVSERRVKFRLRKSGNHLSAQLVYAFDLLIGGVGCLWDVPGKYDPQTHEITVPLSLKNGQCRGKKIEMRYSICKSVKVNFTAPK